MSDAALGDDWTHDEIVATVASYLNMLRLERQGEHYSKAEYRRQLMTFLSPARTEAAVEFKHQNVSAVMVELGLPYIRGYRPARNYQSALAEEVRRRLGGDSRLLAELRTVMQPRATPGLELVGRPESGSGRGRSRSARIVDFEALQAESRQLGKRGEELVLEYEVDNLRRSERADLASRVRWVSRDDGDGAGYDILSFTPDDRVRHIEVKTTSLGATTPFYLSSSELTFALDHPESYVIYRVFDVNDAPRFFVIEGAVTDQVDLVPVSFRAHLI